jgi:hypothetical protein
VSHEANYSVTFKTPKGNLLTVRADSADEWVTHLKNADTSGALSTIAGIEATLSGQPRPTQPVPGGRQANPAQPSAQTATAGGQQPAQELLAGMGVKCDTCQAPARFEKEGVSGKSGRPYKRYSCTANALHKATFTD